jgi:hypothetical protein
MYHGKVWVEGSMLLYASMTSQDLLGWISLEKNQKPSKSSKIRVNIFQREKESVIVKIRSGHDKEFENAKFFELFSSEGIAHEFSSPITPQ